MKAHNIKFGTCWLNLVPYNASPLHIKYAKYKIHQKTMFLNYSNQRVDFEESATFTEMILILECHFLSNFWVHGFVLCGSPTNKKRTHVFPF